MGECGLQAKACNPELAKAQLKLWFKFRTVPIPMDSKIYGGGFKVFWRKERGEQT